MKGSPAFRALIEEFAATTPLRQPIGRKSNLYEVLKRFPELGKGVKVAPLQWVDKGLKDCYYLVTRAELKPRRIHHGHAWGVRFWKGRPVEKETQIKGDLRWNWTTV
ncbi:hypothetical protein SAICODRAFT_19700 [Saitoella complicata NRRL Y-17804]|uniref:Uncharacterized protein n=1 Tax=Saitoella complicata (strain BCRC 22490 / CBS 7301 / JCM 7358 / NBRC 10748 / NRRL Y-17804) TaxID=698492 RepID=A0A0E9NM10_SAICN|nr:uncharacterized protein SAICODRAFT_19700 [Saitoella complicata NRRL Y-17804]ODQ52520.1 hypothetical protein SAICODRAFT_19700 [Saitoella complicata NRRL Y-17804]GAO50445.1 hypothetical protein G7K_4570-t1 [Saitoella complicata NRRL Y-17804]